MVLLDWLTVCSSTAAQRGSATSSAHQRLADSMPPLAKHALRSCRFGAV